METSRSSVVHWLWTNNPFYVISALLMLYAVRASYGQLEIGAINCWVMTGVLAAYTSVLAAVGVMIVRWGQVWDDARSILIVLLLMFLAVSVSADDLFVKMESPAGAAALLGCGLAFSVMVFQSVLRGARIRLGWAFQIPFVLFLALFYATPWWCSPELHPRNAWTLDWTVFLFPQVAAILCLTLLPAVRRGRRYAENSGTPWNWPWFPWVAFGVIGGAVILRSYALSLTFSQTGPIWQSPESRSGIVLDTIWRPYFVVPFVAAVLLLVMEAGLAAGNHRLVRRVMLAAGLLIPLAWPWANTVPSAEFVTRLTSTAGSPVWLAIWLVMAFYGYAMVRRVPLARIGFLGTAGLLGAIGPQTVSIPTLAWQPAPLLAVGAVLVIAGILRRSSALTLVATAVVAGGLWMVLSDSPLAPYRAAICYHTLLVAGILLSLMLTDRLARILQPLCSSWLSLSALAVMVLPAAGVPQHWRLWYVAGLMGVCLACAWISRSRSYWAGFAGTTSVLGYSLAGIGFRSAGAAVGRNAVAAFSWSLGTLMIGTLISAYKAGWLPPLTLPAWDGLSDQGPSPGTVTLDTGTSGGAEGTESRP